VTCSICAATPLTITHVHTDSVQQSFTVMMMYLICVSLRGRKPSVPVCECVFELPQVCVQATRAQVLLLQCMYRSWTHSVGGGACISDSLLSHAYKTPGTFETPRVCRVMRCVCVSSWRCFIMTAVNSSEERLFDHITLVRVLVLMECCPCVCP